MKHRYYHGFGRQMECACIRMNFSISTYPEEKIDEINSLDQNLNL
jgi:hypothetical protein